MFHRVVPELHSGKVCTFQHITKYCTISLQLFGHTGLSSYQKFSRCLFPSQPASNTSLARITACIDCHLYGQIQHIGGGPSGDIMYERESNFRAVRVPKTIIYAAYSCSPLFVQCLYRGHRLEGVCTYIVYVIVNAR